MMPFMYDLHQLLRDIVSKYIKPEMLNKCKKTLAFFLMSTKNHLSGKEVDIGFGTKNILTNKMKT